MRCVRWFCSVGKNMVSNKSIFRSSAFKIGLKSKQEGKVSGESEREKNEQERDGRGYSARGAGNAERRMVSPVLGSSWNCARSLRHSPSGQSARRRAGVVSRRIRQARLTRTALPASRHVVGICRYRMRRHPLPLSWLAFRRLGSVSGNAGRAQGQQVSAEGEASIVSGARTGRIDLRVHGTRSGRSTAAAEVWAIGRSRQPMADRAGAPRRLQLV